MPHWSFQLTHERLAAAFFADSVGRGYLVQPPRLQAFARELQFFAFHRNTICGNGCVSSASLVFVAISFVRAMSKKLPVTVHTLLYVKVHAKKWYKSAKCICSKWR